MPEQGDSKRYLSFWMEKKLTLEWIGGSVSVEDSNYKDFQRLKVEVIEKSLESCWKGDEPPDVSREMQEIVKIEKRIERKRKHHSN